MNRRLMNKSILFSPFVFRSKNIQSGTIKIGNDFVKIPDRWELRNVKYNEKAVVNYTNDFKTVLNQDLNGVPVCRTMLYYPNDNRFNQVYIVPFTLCLNEKAFTNALKDIYPVGPYDHGLILYMEDLNLYGFVTSTYYEFQSTFQLMS